MVTASALVGLVVILAVNTVVAALATRFFRFQLATTWGATVFVAIFVPVVYVATTLLLGGTLGLGDDVFGSTGALLLVTWALPFAIGVAFDVFWMPAPDEVEPPATVGRD